MPVQIQTRIEGKRGCGWRKPGGLYLVAPSEGHPCCKLPHKLEVCPCCGQGIKPARGWTWVDVGQLFGGTICTQEEVTPMLTVRRDCPLAHPEKMGRAGLIWVGDAYYPTPEDFQAEASRMGVSRRITAVPREFRLGETWVLLAHRKCFPELTKEKGELLETTKYLPGIFSVFKPVAIEYVVKGDETEVELERLVERGITPVDVNPRRAYK